MKTADFQQVSHLGNLKIAYLASAHSVLPADARQGRNLYTVGRLLKSAAFT
jgi:hypothetical protein